jgi:hypothetical protein
VAFQTAFGHQLGVVGLGLFHALPNNAVVGHVSGS